MRSRSEVRRDAILAAAAEEFGLRGYEGASISAIAARAGGSKQTLYAYFPSKDELFVEVMMRTIQHCLEIAQSGLDEGGDVAQSLCRYGEQYLWNRQTPELVALHRLAFGEAGRSDVGRLMYERAKIQGLAKISAFLDGAIQAGKLRPADTKLAALHFYALVDAELVDPVVLRVREPATNEEIAEIAARAIQVFMAAYGPN